MTTVTYAQPLADGQSKFLGCCIGYTTHSNFDDYWNQVTPENAGKWGSVEYAQDSYNWTQLDNIYSYAKNKGFPYKHHTLVWGQQQPSWISSLDSADQRAEVEEWIQLIGEKYPDADYVEVVNEPFHAPPSYKDALGGNGKTGFDWIITAFEWAREYCDSSTMLLINEYNILHDNTQTNNYLRIIDTLNARGLIDGISVQGHSFEFFGSGYTWSITTIKNNLNKLVATGLPFYLSEFDINEEDDDVQLQKYQTYFPIFWEHPGVKGITLWGYLQNECWRADAYLLTDRMRPRPAMEWLEMYIVSPFPPVLIDPLKTTDEPLDPILKWHPSDSADAYHVQVSTLSSFSNIIVDTTVNDTSVQINSLSSDTRYYWRASAQNEHGESRYTSTTYFYTMDTTTTAINKLNENPSSFILYQNYPNPFNPVTTIKYSLDKSIRVHLSIYNISGQKICNLVEQNQNIGVHQVLWDGRDGSGQLVPSGTYFYKIDTGDFTQVRKMLLMK